MGLTRNEAIRKLDDLGFLTPEQLIDGLVALGVLALVSERKFNEA